MKKVNNLKWFTLGIVVCLSLTTLIVPAFASTISKTAQLLYNDIKITLNGNELNPKDVNSNTVEPFIIDGTTYLPVRSISNALNMSVDWDAENNTVVLNNYAYQYAQLQKCFVKLDDTYDNLAYALDESKLYYDCLINGCITNKIKDNHFNFRSSMLNSDGIIESAINSVKDEIKLIENLNGPVLTQGINTANKLCEDMITSLNDLRGIDSAIYRIEHGYSDGYQMYIDNNADATVHIMDNDAKVTEALITTATKLIDITK